MRPRLAATVAVVALVALTATPALACGGLIGPNGAVNLLRTTTFAGYHDGVEHYVTAFEFAGGRRTVRLAHPAARACRRASSGRRLDAPAAGPRDQPPVPEAVFARGGRSAASGARGPPGDADRRARHHGPQGRRRRRSARGPRSTASACRPMRPRSSTSTRSAARSSWPRASRRRRRRAGPAAVGDGTPVHITIPTDQAVGPAAHPRPRQDRRRAVDADVFLLTDARAAASCRRRRPGLTLAHSGRRATACSTDLRSDKGMDWVPVSVADQDRAGRRRRRSSPTTSRSTPRRARRRGSPRGWHGRRVSAGHRAPAGTALILPARRSGSSAGLAGIAVLIGRRPVRAVTSPDGARATTMGAPRRRDLAAPAAGPARGGCGVGRRRWRPRRGDGGPHHRTGSRSEHSHYEPAAFNVQPGCRPVVIE